MDAYIVVDIDAVDLFRRKADRFCVGCRPACAAVYTVFPRRGGVGVKLTQGKLGTAVTVECEFCDLGFYLTQQVVCHKSGYV